MLLWKNIIKIAVCHMIPIDGVMPHTADFMISAIALADYFTITFLPLWM